MAHVTLAAMGQLNSVWMNNTAYLIRNMSSINEQNRGKLQSSLLSQTFQEYSELIQTIVYEMIKS